MNLDSLTLHSITTELQELLTSGQISKIYQLDARSLYFRIFNDQGSHHLVIILDDAPRLYVADRMPPTPDVPTGLCMFLRKYYENGRIASIKQIHLDRLIEISVDVLNTHGRLVTRKIHIELMGKYSNVIFTENGIILEALIKTAHGKQAVRTIAPKEPYDFPPNSMRMNPFDFSAQELIDIMTVDTSEALGKWMIKHFNGMSTVILDELSCRTGFNKDTPLTALSQADIFSWCRAVEQLGQELKQVSGIYVYTRDGKDTVSPFLLKSLEKYPRQHYKFVEDYLNTYEQVHHNANSQQEELKRKVKKLIEKQNRKIKRIADEMKETDKMNIYKLYGDLLMIYAYMKQDHKSSVTVDNILSEKQKKTTIPMDPSYTMTDNANRYYKRYTKMRNRIQMSQKLHDDNQRYLEYLHSIEYALNTVDGKYELMDIKAEMAQMGLLKSVTRDKLRKESAQQILTVKADGIDIWIGRNNRQNDFLTLKKAHPYDLWFHTKNMPGSHVILACHHVEPTEHQISMAAQLAAYYSKGRLSSKVEVDSTYCRYVKKPAHAAPGYVIFENQTTYNVKPKDWSKEAK